MPPLTKLPNAPLSILLLGVLCLASAHGHGENLKMDMGHSAPAVTATPAHTDPENYFQYDEHSVWLVAHILLTTIAWVFVLPIGVMFSISRSRYSLPTQFAFFLLHTVAVIFATIYNASTPDLYPNNAHHKLGWILTWVISAQVVMGVIRAYTMRRENNGFSPISQQAIAEHQHRHGIGRMDSYRMSNDSGHGTQTTSESSRSNSPFRDEQLGLQEGLEEDGVRLDLVKGTVVDRYLSGKILALCSSRFLRVCEFSYNLVDRTILVLGFAALTTGMVTYGGLFKGDKVFSGLAHFIKGGVFFWYGILTLGRWAGCFAEVGWAWNIKPTVNTVGARRKPSAEFVESFLIFFYGSTNIFLEHLAAWGNEWSAQDLEHISLTIMFLGGGLCGMLIESKRIRNLMNTPTHSHPRFAYLADKEVLVDPRSYEFSMNPIPALVVLLLGMMMSSHHQESMVSTMIHAQWGTLLVGAAFARAATYVVFYLSPPTSILPGRPPTELITAFCLMAGGMIFMSSARDTVETMELYGLDAMFIFTVSMGVITFLMAWIIVVIAVKGWAVRKENKWSVVPSEA